MSRNKWISITFLFVSSAYQCRWSRCKRVCSMYMQLLCRFTTANFCTGFLKLTYTAVHATCSPMIIMVLLWSGSIPIPSRHTTTVPLRSTVAVTVAVDVMDLVINCTSVTLKWNGGWLVITLPRLLGRRDRVMFNDGMFHWCAREEIVHVNITLSPGHGLSTLDCNWAPEAEGEQWT